MYDFPNFWLTLFPRNEYISDKVYQYNIIYNSAKIASFQPLIYTSSPIFQIFEKYGIFMKL